MNKKTEKTLKAVNDNNAPQMKNTNSILGWILLAVLLVGGLYFAFR